MKIFHCVLLLATGLAMVTAQVPGIGSCPEKVAMANFQMDEFMGTWFEVERMFQLLETASRCVAANYTKSNDGKIRVYNHLTSRITGIERILEGELKTSSDKKDEGKLAVKYSVLPLPIDTEYSILDTDYKSYAVLWHCSSLIPFFNTQNAWVMTRDRKPLDAVLQKAYGVLDKLKIPRSGFTKVIQENCGDDSSPSTTAAAAAVPTTPPTVPIVESAVPSARGSDEIAPESAPAVPQKVEALSNEPLLDSKPVEASIIPKEVEAPSNQPQSDSKPLEASIIPKEDEAPSSSLSDPKPMEASVIPKEVEASNSQPLSDPKPVEDPIVPKEVEASSNLPMSDPKPVEASILPQEVEVPSNQLQADPKPAEASIIPQEVESPSNLPLSDPKPVEDSIIPKEVEVPSNQPLSEPKPVKESIIPQETPILDRLEASNPALPSAQDPVPAASPAIPQAPSPIEAEAEKNEAEKLKPEDEKKPDEPPQA